MPDLSIPETPGTATAEWLTDALRSTGTLTEGCVTAVTAETLGEGVGLFGQLGKLALTYDPPNRGPASLVIKLDSTAAANRDLANTLGIYRREVGFYHDLAPAVAVRTPACYYADFRETDGRVVLLLEDLSAYRNGDQIAGASLAEARAAVLMAAELHAAFWAGAGLALPDWLPSTSDPAQVSLAHSVYDSAIDPLLQAWGDRLSPAARRVFAGMNQWQAWLDRLSAPPITLVHGDFRLDNFLFGADPAQDTILLDWQMVSQARGPYDLAIFLVDSMDPALRRAHESDLLHLYHDALCAHGVRDYSFDDCLEDYRYALFGNMRIAAVLGNPDFDLANERGLQLALVILDRAAAAFDDHQLDQLLPLS